METKLLENRSSFHSRTVWFREDEFLMTSSWTGNFYVVY